MKHRKWPQVLATCSLLLLVGVLAPISQLYAQAGMLRDVGILYVRSEHRYQGLFATYEWWVDAQNPWRFRRITTLQSEVLKADGSDGVTAWWAYEKGKGATRYEGRYWLMQSAFGGATNINLKDWFRVFMNEGYKEVSTRRSAQEVTQSENAPWGSVFTIRRDNGFPAGSMAITKVRAEEPHILIEKVVLDNVGKETETLRLTQWEWLDAAQLDSDFWMTPPGGPSLVAITAPVTEPDPAPTGASTLQPQSAVSISSIPGMPKAGGGNLARWPFLMFLILGTMLTVLGLVVRNRLHPLAAERQE